MLLEENRALLARFREGDREALEKVFMAHANVVASFLKRGFSFDSGGRRCRYQGTRSQFDLEDKVHDVFARAFTASARLNYDGLTPYTSYLITIARNLVIDDFRKKTHALIEYTLEEVDAASPVGGEASEPMLGALSPSGNPEQDVENQELISIVRAFKESLPAREREVFRLRFEEEREHKAIAEATGLSPSKIKTSEQRIREGFFSRLRAHGYFGGYAKTRPSVLKSKKGAR